MLSPVIPEVVCLGFPQERLDRAERASEGEFWGHTCLGVGTQRVASSLLWDTLSSSVKQSVTPQNPAGLGAWWGSGDGGHGSPGPAEGSLCPVSSGQQVF